MSHVPVPVLRRMQDEPLAVPDADRRHQGRQNRPAPDQVTYPTFC